MLGKVSWIASIDRFFFALFSAAYRLNSSHRKRSARPSTRVRLSKRVREEFEFFSVLMGQMCARLRLNPCPIMIAGDSSLEAWAIVMRKSGQFGNSFPPGSGLNSSEIVRGLMRGEQWRTMRRREFRTRLAQILPGELTAFRQGAAIAVQEIAEAPLGALGSIMGETLGRAAPGGAWQIWEQRPMRETVGGEGRH